MTIALVGCTGSVPTPTRVVETSPDGKARELPLSAALASAGQPPATAQALANLPRATTFPTSTVAPAAFLEPVGVTPLKPFAAWTEQEAAAEALGRIGPAAVPALIEALRSPEPAVRRKAAEVLGRMGPDAKDATAELIRLLDDPDESVRKAATRTLGRIGPSAQEAVPALMRSLLDPEA
jgi:HEAT repeat protein